MHVDGGRSGKGRGGEQLRGGRVVWERGGGLGGVRDSNHSCLYLLATLKKLIYSDRGCTSLNLLFVAYKRFHSRQGNGRRTTASKLAERRRTSIVNELRPVSGTISSME